MKKVNIGLIGYGIVGSGVAELLTTRRAFMKAKYQVDFDLVSVCDLRFKKQRPKGLKGVKLVTDAGAILNAPDINVIVELIGGVHPAKEFVTQALKSGKHVVTANKALIANYGKELFRVAEENGVGLYFESAVGAGVPIIKSISEGLAGNEFKAVYGIVNGTCNFILGEMTEKGYSFEDALKQAQANGFAEADPTLDINGMDSAHKLAVLIILAFGKFLSVKDVYVEGITRISRDDIEYAESLGLTIKLLTIAKKTGKSIEARVHPTLIPKTHPLASINGVYNAVYMESDPMGKVMISGEGAGKMAAASGVISDLVNLATRPDGQKPLCDIYDEHEKLSVRTIDNIESKFYIRFQAVDQPGVLAKITGVLGKHRIGINSVSQRIHNSAQAVPVIMLTEYTTEKELRAALNQIEKLSVIKSRPVAIRMEKLA